MPGNSQYVDLPGISLDRTLTIVNIDQLPGRSDLRKIGLL